MPEVEMPIQEWIYVGVSHHKPIQTEFLVKIEE
jgi:hypothetical protein